MFLPILKQYHFGATFFITEAWDFEQNKKDYMTWKEISILHQEGFEIGNHTRDHINLKKNKLRHLKEQLEAIDKKCKIFGIPKPVSFSWPGNQYSIEALKILNQHGFLYARRGGSPEFPYKNGQGFAFEPGKDHPLLMPSAGDARPDWTLEDFKKAVQQAKDGKNSHTTISWYP